MKSPSRLFAICVAAACLAAGFLASAAQAAAPAWAPIAHSGPTNLPPVQDEIQRVSVDAEGGTYKLTAPKAGCAVTGNLGLANSSFISGVEEASGSCSVGQTIVGEHILPGTTITSIFIFFGSKVFELSQPATNKAPVTNVTFVTFGTSGPTLAIPFNASASEVEAALNALPGVSATVAGGPGGKGAAKPYFVSFEGDLKGKDVPEMSADSSELTGGNNHIATITTALEGGPGTGSVLIYAQNVGGVPSSGTTRVAFTLPEGVKTAAKPGTGGWNCPGGAGSDGMTCTHTPGFFGPLPADPGFTLSPLVVPIVATESAQSGHVNIKVWGGGAGESTEETAANFDMPLIVSEIPAPIGLQAFNAGTYKNDGTIDTRAGAHPYSAASGFLVNTVRAPDGEIVPAGEARNIFVDTPPGFFGNPISTPQCPEAFELSECPRESIVATVKAPVGRFGSNAEFQSNPVYNIEAPFGFPAKFRFVADVFGQVVINVVASLRSDEDYGLEIGSYNTPQIKPLFGAFFTIWGSPFDAGHDKQRCPGFNNVGIGSNCLTHDQIIEEGGEEVAFLTNPVDCAEEAARAPVATVNVNTWQAPQLLFAGKVALKPVTECDDDELKAFKADFAFEPTSAKAADSPAAFSTELSIPPEAVEGLLIPNKRMNPTIRESVVDLPDGVVLNASAADGLAACSMEQIGLIGTNKPRPNEIRFTKNPNTCPDNSKIGSGELKSELIEEPLQADLFLAAQGDGNPFGSLFAIYLVIEDPRNGIFIKLPGEVQVNEQTGKQRIVFKDLPPLPFTYLKLNLKGGPRSPLATPTTCGNFTTNATNTPWSAPESGPPHVSGNSFAIDQGPNGGPCANTPGERPFGIGLRAGSTNPVAGAHSPFQIQLTRADGNQELDRLEIAMPPGFVASLRGIPYCSDAQIATVAGGSGKAEQRSSACPAASRVGSTNSAAGSGSHPFYAPGALYLAGPYKGAPLSVVAITPAVAGPFDLGNVVVRSALRIDPVTARITAHTDPLPRILKGVPLRIRDVRVNLDRPAWAQNPTSCEAMAVNVTAYGSHGAVSQPSNRFQVGNCRALGFKPKTRIQLFGGVKRGKYQGVRAVVRPRPGDANISRTVVRFPRSAFVAQEHIRTICTRVQFAADACPKGSIYGRAIAYSPLLDMPLRGNVYLRSSDNALPDAVADLRGPAHQPIKIEVSIRNDSVRGALRNTVLAAPDAPVSYFRLQMFGKQKGLIVNSRNICRGKNQARVAMAAHNGRRSVERVNVFNRKCKKQRRKAKRSAHRRAKSAAVRARGRH